NFSPDQPFTVDAAAHLPGSGAQEVRLQGDGGPLVQGQPAATPFHGTLSLKQVGIADLSKFLNSPALVNTDGTISGETKIVNEGGKLTARGQTNIQNAKIHDIDLGYQIPAINLNLTPAQIQSNNFNVTSGGTTVNAQFALRDYLAKTPLVDATLKAPNAALPALLSMAKAYGVKGVDKINGAGTLNLDMHAAGPLRAISSDEIMKALNGTLNLNFNNVKYSGADINHELASIAGFLNKSNTASQGFTNILRMTGNVLVKNVIAQTNNLQALLDLGNLGVAGTANLVT